MAALPQKPDALDGSLEFRQCARSGHYLFSTDQGIAAATGSSQSERRVWITTNSAVLAVAAPMSLP